MSDITIPDDTPKRHAPGVYFGLDEDAYHADPALGSTDIRRCARNPSSYWFSSWMNPNRKPETDTPGRVRGRAMHKLLYEPPMFERLYMCGARHDLEMTSAEKGAATKAANVKAAAAGKIALPSADYDQVLMAHAMITKNPKLKDVFANGFSEVSIFWVDPETGVACKARIDYLKIRGNGDLKGVANQYDKDFRQACIEAIANYRYEVQAKFYMNARMMLGKFWSDGAMFGDHDPDLFKKIALSTTWGWQWVFYQTEGAPITYSRSLSPGNVAMLEIAQAVIDQGLRNYRQNLEAFGTEMWMLLEDVGELVVDDMPGWWARTPRDR